MTDEAGLISKVCGVTGISEGEARHLLEAFQWDYAEAVKAHFDSEDHGDRPTVSTTSPSSFSPVHNPAPPPPPGGKIITFDKIRSPSREGPEEGQAFYVGGSETGGGGQQVLGPPRKHAAGSSLPDPTASPDDFVRSLFQAAQGQGAEVLDSERYKERSGGAKARVPFSGTGYRLGEDPNAPSQVESGSRPKPKQNDESEHNVIVKMWRDGFSLDDGPLRNYTDQESRTFLEDIQAGRVPKELIRSACGGLVNVLLEDHHHEAWHAPPTPKVKPFSGTGTMLGHPLPRIVSSAPQQSQSAPVPAPEVDASKPTTELQIRLPDGERLVIRLNHSHTIEDIRKAVISKRPDLAAHTFTLMTTFPNRELTDDAQTVADAKLLHSALLVRFTS
ncbi:unnamed protein product [Calicophoron daubneyi]|uniref:NSFL1 cofactor p47 n=1 Tax=Calicophoron daubneyi TaxID=300641 RepID=A0AAV2TDH6_CALDB